jgi:hypothetical protein
MIPIPGRICETVAKLRACTAVCSQQRLRSAFGKKRCSLLACVPGHFERTQGFPRKIDNLTAGQELLRVSRLSMSCLDRGPQLDTRFIQISPGHMQPHISVY